ncbi:MAG: FHA domain-containing protein [Dehalococcoidia bacterium]
MIEEYWSLILLGLRVAVATGLYLFLLITVRAIRAELRVRTAATPAALPAAAPQPARSARGPDHLEVIAYEAMDERGGGEALVGLTFPLSGPALVGRGATSTIVLAEPHVSSRHARLVPEDGMWWVEDLGSTNGTFVDEQPVDGWAPVSLGSEVRFGPVVARVRPGVEDDGAATAEPEARPTEGMRTHR